MGVPDYVEQDKRLWIPPWAEVEEPVDGGEADEPNEPLLPVNLPTGEVKPAAEEELRREVARHGVAVEPEIARSVVEAGGPGPNVLASYMSEYPTRFFYRSDVGRSINRIQAEFPWVTYACTYVRHPPVFGHKYEHVSVDYWGGGLDANGRYVGYRGKPIGRELGDRVFNVLFRDPHRPNIYWIIWGGRMWTRGYGWGPSPGGPPDSDAGHYLHIHVSYLL